MVLTEWHRARGGVDLPVARKSAAALTNPDDREASLRGCLLARAISEPDATLREAASREDFPQIAETAFRHWLTRDPGAAWNFTATFKEDPVLPVIVTALLKAEIDHRRVSESLPEVTTLLSRLSSGAGFRAGGKRTKVS